MLAAHLIALGMWFQESDSLSAGNTKLLMIFIGIVAFSMLSQAVIFLFMAIGAAKTQKQVLAIANEVHEAALPAIKSVQELVCDTAPKMRVITENLAETSHILRAKAVEIDVTLTDVNDRTRRQVARVDGMVSSTLTAVSEISSSIQQSIRTPVREVAGLVNGLKAGLDVLVGRVRSFGGARRAPRDF